MVVCFGDVVHRPHHERRSCGRVVAGFVVNGSLVPSERERGTEEEVNGGLGGGVYGSQVGKDQREGDSPSWFNPHECNLVLDLVRALLCVRGKRIAPSDIGVITPYNKQAQKIVRMLKARDLPCGAGEIKVGFWRAANSSLICYIPDYVRFYVISPVTSVEEF